MKALSLSLIIMIFATMSLWAGITHNYELSAPEFTPTGRGLELSLPGAHSLGHPSEPDLPWFGYKLLLPLGSEACDVVIKRYGQMRYHLDDIIRPIQTQYPISHAGNVSWDEPSTEIYASNTIFPKQAQKGLTTEFLNGHPIAMGTFSAFDYYPQARELVFYSSITVEVNYHSTPRAAAALSLLKKDSFIIQRLKTSVDNQAEIPQYSFSREGTCEYLMIIDGSKMAQWQPLVDYYQNRGLSVMLQAVDEIYANTPGRDPQEKIRNFIIEIYSANPLRYVLLGGDTEAVPHRGLYIFNGSAYVDESMPADMYYACLDGDWNTNNNTLWGEPDEADLIPELAIGRICYNNDAEIANQINKIIMYQDYPVEAHIKSASMLGESMDGIPTYGGDYMDEMIGGSDHHNFITAGIPLDWDIETLYDRNSMWNSSDALDLLANGANLVNHLGHSGKTYNMKISSFEVTTNNISNDGVNQNYSIYFTQGCDAGSFDNAGAVSHIDSPDCISEKFTALPTSAVGMISHSRYGWYVYGSTNGASQRLHRQYIDAIFGEDIHALGYTLADAKIDIAPYVISSPTMRWVTYETNLFGCPATSVWSDAPSSITATLPAAWLVDLTQYSIQTNAPFAQIKIKRTTDIYYEGFADESGLINIDLQESLAPGNYVLYLSAANFYPSAQNIFVTASDMPYVICDNVTTSATDGILQIGDTADLSVTIKNMGMVDLDSGGTITLSSDSDNIQILQGEYSFAAFSLSDSLYAENAFQIGIVGSFADRTEVSLTFQASFESYETQSFHSLVLSAPVLNISSYTSHGDNPYIMPGDAATIDLSIQNTGRGTAYEPTLQISCNDAGITLSTTELSLPLLEAGEDLVLEDAFSFSISADVELGTDINISYILGADSGTVVEGAFLIPIGMLSFDFELDMQEWISSQINPIFIQQWQRTDEKNTTEDGAYSVKFGGQSPTEYAVNAYGALTSPELDLAPDSRLKFMHWMDAQAHNTLPNKAWDGGNVQMSINGGAWFMIDPVGSYPYSIHNSAISPFGMGTPVYSGSFDWTEAEFDLSAYSGTARIRFVFGSDDSICGEGWYIDDIRLECDLPTGIEQLPTPAAWAMDQNYPNPFNPSTTISFTLPKAQPAKLSIYNLKGQLVKKLLDTALPAGQTSMNWDGTDEHGNPVSSGIYSYRLQSAGKSITRKMILMK